MNGNDQSEIRLINLEDKNMIAKIEVPNIFDEWYKGFPSNAVRNKLAISEIAREGCGHSIILNTESRAYFEKSELNRLADFFNNNSKILIEMLNNYASEAYYVKPVKKYYVQLIAGDEESYLNINPDGRSQLGSNLEIDGCKSKFTREEIIAIDPRLVPFMEEVEDDE